MLAMFVRRALAFAVGAVASVVLLPLTDVACGDIDYDVGRGFCNVGVAFLIWPFVLAGGGLLASAIVKGGRGALPLLADALPATGAWLIVFPGDVDAVVLPFLFASTFLLVGYGIGRGLARVMRVLRQPRHGTGSGA